MRLPCSLTDREIEVGRYALQVFWGEFFQQYKGFEVMDGPRFPAVFHQGACLIEVDVGMSAESFYRSAVHRDAAPRVVSMRNQGISSW